MKISILTMFPEMFDGMKQSPIIQHAIEKDIVQIELIDIKEFADGSFRDIDDSPYGGGAGMILRCEPISKALLKVKQENSFTIMSAPAGISYTQKKAHEYAKKEHLILLCGHYEGIDARMDDQVDEKISIGDYIVSSGEYPAMIITDSIVRLLDGVIKKKSIEDESFENGLLEYPQYTRPLNFNGKEVPEVLLSGNHEKIRQYRHQESLKMTLKYKPELLDFADLSQEDKAFIKEFKK